VNQFNAGLLILRVIFGLFLAYHGYNKFFGPGGLAGTARLFESIGMRRPHWQARLAATTEVVSGVLLAAGMLTPLAAAGMIGMVGPGRWSLDHAFGIEWHGWTGAIVAGVAGVGAALAQLAIFYRPQPAA